jgi:hypothetical protein
VATETRPGDESSEDARSDRSLRYGALVMTLGYAALCAFGVVLAVRILGGEGVVESGVDIGASAADLAAFNPALPHYIAHIRMATAGMFVGLGLLGAAVAWYGVRRGERWAWAASTVALVVGTAIGVPMHYGGAFHVDGVRHLGPAFVALALFAVGAVVAYPGLGTHAEAEAAPGREGERGTETGVEP